MNAGTQAVLVLSRRKHESVVVDLSGLLEMMADGVADLLGTDQAETRRALLQSAGRDVRLTVLVVDTQSHRTRLAFEAHRSIHVGRLETEHSDRRQMGMDGR